MGRSVRIDDDERLMPDLFAEVDGAHADGHGRIGRLVAFRVFAASFARIYNAPSVYPGISR